MSNIVKLNPPDPPKGSASWFRRMYENRNPPPLEELPNKPLRMSKNAVKHLVAADKLIRAMRRSGLPEESARELWTMMLRSKYTAEGIISIALSVLWGSFEDDPTCLS